VKARIISDDGDLEFALIEVPFSDPRPAFDPKMDSLKEKGGVGHGNPEGGR
jgi:hypothetical protein